jgi:hypothetical protein
MIMPVVNETTYSDKTDPEVIRVLENARLSGERIRWHYGDTQTGRDWLEEYEIEGRIGRSTGTSKIPLCISNSGSIGGGGLLDHCIVKITARRGRRRVTLYQHPKYQRPCFTIQPTAIPSLPFGVYRQVDLEVYENQANFKTRAAATRYITKMRDLGVK